MLKSKRMIAFFLMTTMLITMIGAYAGIYADSSETKELTRVSGCPYCTTSPVRVSYNLNGCGIGYSQYNSTSHIKTYFQALATCLNCGNSWMTNYSVYEAHTWGSNMICTKCNYSGL